MEDLIRLMARIACRPADTTCQALRTGEGKFVSAEASKLMSVELNDRWRRRPAPQLDLRPSRNRFNDKIQRKGVGSNGGRDRD